MKRGKNIAVLMLLLSTKGILAQTLLFLNLGFEQATIIPVEGHPYYPDVVAVSNALPRWSVHTGYWAWEDDLVLYNWVPLDAPGVSIYDTNRPYVPVLRGQYTVYLQSSSWYNLEASIKQTGHIPSTAKSIRFVGDLNIAT